MIIIIIIINNNNNNPPRNFFTITLNMKANEVKIMYSLH